MTLLLAAILGLGLVAVIVRYGFRWLLRAVGVWLLLWVWLILGHLWSPLGYAGYTFPFAVAAWIFRHRLARRFPQILRLLEKIPRRKQKVLERAFRDEMDSDGKRVIPKVTRWERFDA